jgi:hypothetical protein
MHFLGKQTALVIFSRKQPIEFLTEHFRLGPVKKALRTETPTVYVPKRIRADDSCVSSTIYYLTKMRCGQCRLTNRAGSFWH